MLCYTTHKYDKPQLLSGTCIMIKELNKKKKKKKKDDKIYQTKERIIAKKCNTRLAYVCVYCLQQEHSESTDLGRGRSFPVWKYEKEMCAQNLFGVLRMLFLNNHSVSM